MPRLFLLSVLSGSLAFSPSLVAQSSVDWEVVGGGTGLSSGGTYSVQGTIGQASTAQAKGGRYTLASGFWTYTMIVATPGAPALQVNWDAASSRLRLTWPRPADGWVLQSTDTLAGPETIWIPLEGPYDSTDTELEWLVAPPPGPRFYRLQNPSLP